MKRTLMEAEHEEFRTAFGRFVEREIVPHHEEWEQQGIVPRELWARAGSLGFLGLGVEERWGGTGIGDFRFNCVVNEELIRRGATGVGFPLHLDVVVPCLARLGTDEQKQRWLPGCCAGELIGAIAISESGAGSDVEAISTSAVRGDGGWVLNGQKTYVSNGINADVVVVAAKTNPAGGALGLTLFLVERDMPGFERGRRLAKMGLHAQDTAEMFFHDVAVSEANVLGRPGMGFAHLMQNLVQERLSIAVGAVAACEAAIEQALGYTRERSAFGRSLAGFQQVRFFLAEMATELAVARSFVDRCVAAHLAGGLTAAEAAMAKWWTSELQQRILDRCLQLHGGNGYMLEYPIARAYLDGRVQTIYGGTTEIMKDVVARSLGI